MTAPAPRRSVSIRNAHPRLRVPRAAVRRAIALLDSAFVHLPADLPHLSGVHSKIINRKSKIPGACPPGELSVVFLTDAAQAVLHADFMDDPTPTDVITFEGYPAAGLAGEICVSADTAMAYSRRHRQDFATELTLYVVHGWLHLAGYDDLHPAKKRRMRLAEKRALSLLRAAKAIPGFLLV